MHKADHLSPSNAKWSHISAPPHCLYGMQGTSLLHFTLPLLLLLLLLLFIFQFLHCKL